MSALKITILGCGSSFGVPLFHNIWGKCDPKEPKNIRSRPSILVQKNGKNLLIDTSPDLKQQILSNKIDNIDAVFYTHEHADHTHGINELRSINLIHRKIIPCYGNEQTMKKIKLTPLADKVIVQQAEAETKTASGIIIPDTAQEKPQKGHIVAVGKGTKENPITVKVGDSVLYGKYAGTELKFDGEDFLIMKESDILAIIK